jgi:hypothetical protein
MLSTFFGLALILAVTGTSNVSLRVHSTNSLHDVYVAGKYVGSDPDVRVRRELLRDQY